METREQSVERAPGWSWFVLIGICLLLLIIGVIKSCKKESEEAEKQKTKTEVIKKLPDIYNEYPVLKRGKVVRVNVPSGYSYTCSGGGKKYYHQAQNTSKPEIWGDGTYHSAGEHISYFDLFYYNEEITVVCEFKKL